jgi:hypothetical protein
MNEDIWHMVEVEDRRGSLRQPAGIQIVRLAQDDTSTYEAVVVNISRTGMLLTSTHRLPEGGEATVYPPDGFTNLRPLRVSIQRRREHLHTDESWFEYGLSFVD